MAHGKISLAGGIRCCPEYFISFALDASLYCKEHVCIYIHTCLTVYRQYMNCHSYQIILRKKHFYTIWERCEVLTGYFSLSCRPTGRISDTGQNLVQSSFKTANSNSYFHSFFLIAFFEQACILNICMNYVIIIRINNNTIINNNLWKNSKTLFCSS